MEEKDRSATRKLGHRSVALLLVQTQKVNHFYFTLDFTLIVCLL